MLPKLVDWYDLLEKPADIKEIITALDLQEKENESKNSKKINPSLSIIITSKMEFLWNFMMIN
jgi:hypothetical protein